MPARLPAERQIPYAAEPDNHCQSGRAGATRAGQQVGKAQTLGRTYVRRIVLFFNKKTVSLRRIPDAEAVSFLAAKNCGYLLGGDHKAPLHSDNAVKSRGPVNGQDALDASVQVKPTSPRRIGIDYDAGEFVVFDRTLNNVYHGHVRSWQDLHPDMQRTLIKSGMVDKRGNVIGGQ